MELFAADGHDAGGCERVTGKSGMRPADLYKIANGRSKLFFKWIKQNLKVKRFVGRSKNAVLSQLWVATCMCLLLAYLKFVLRLGWSLHRMLRVLQLNLFDRRPLVELFHDALATGLPRPSDAAVVLKDVGTVVMGGSARIDRQTARVLRCHKHPLLRSNFGRRTLARIMHQGPDSR